MKTFIKKSKTLLGSLALAIIMIVSSCINTEKSLIVAPKNTSSASKVEADIKATIVINAKQEIGKSSGPSVIGSTWFTDCADEYYANGKKVLDNNNNAVNDGVIFRNIVNVYDAWYKKNKKTDPCNHPTATDAVKKEMLSKFGSYSIYSSSQKDAIVGQVMNQYKPLNCKGTLKAITTDNATLDFLAIRKQCFEWLHSIALASGGKAVAPTKKADYIVKNISDYKAGMALYKKDNSHGSIITEIVLNTDKTIKYITVVESNWGTGWEKNPYGQIPWSRVISSRTTGYVEGTTQKGDKSFKLSDYDVVKID